MFVLTGGFSQRTAEDPMSFRIDSLVDRRLPAIAPGAVILIARQGQIIYHKSFGTADAKSGRKMSEDMIFRLGSIGKQFTAVAILQLVESKRISLSDSIQKFVPDYPRAASVVNIEHLLTHTSGIKNYFEIDIEEADSTINKFTPKQVVDRFKNEPLKFVPGFRFEYSNSNYFLLGYIIEQVTGLTYRQYLEKNVLKIADLRSTFYIDLARQDLKRATGYSRFEGKQEDADLQSVNLTYAAGGLEGTAADLYTWHKALQKNTVISDSSFRKATKRYRLTDGSLSDYGYGWYLKKIDGMETIEHSGSTDGYQCNVIYLPAEDIYVATLFNCYEADMDWQVTGNDIVRILTGKTLESAVTISTAEMQEFAGLYETIAGGASYKMKVSIQKGKLYIEALNKSLRLPRVELFAQTRDKFYIKEAQLRFEFVRASPTEPYHLVTYNSGGKDAEWKKIAN